MTGKQLQSLLDRAGLSQRGTAKLLGINERTMRRYCAGDSAIPRTVEYAVLWVAEREQKKKDLQAVTMWQ